MKKLFKKSLAVILAVVLTLTAAPLSGFIGLELPGWFGSKASAATYSGACGDNAIWTLHKDTGVLEISGTGPMYDYDDLFAAYQGTYTGNMIPEYMQYADIIKSVSISDGITYIGAFSFFNLSSVQEVTFADTITGIGDFAFGFCLGLISVTLPDSLKTIGMYSFYYTSLASLSIPNAVESVGICAFANCYNLTGKINLSASVNYIGEGAFVGTGSGISIEKNNQYYTSDENGVLFDKAKTQLLYYPFNGTATIYEIPSTVKQIGALSFGAAKNLKSVTIPDSVIEICDEAFFGCLYLESIVIPDSVQKIGASVFVECDSLTDIHIGSGIKSIGRYAFVNTGYTLNINNRDEYGFCYIDNWLIGQFGSFNENDTYCIIRDGTVGIADYLYGDPGVELDLYIPDSVVYIGDDAFANLNIGTIEVDADNKEFFVDELGVLFNADKTRLIKCSNSNIMGSFEIPSTVATIEGGAFWDCEYLTYICLPDSIEHIGYMAFAQTSIKEIDIPDSVVDLGHFAFFECADLESVSIGDSVEYLGADTFCGCENLKNVSIGKKLKGTILADFSNSIISQDILGDTSWLYSKINAGSFDSAVIENIEVDRNNQYYSNDSYGVLFDKSKETLIRYTSGSDRTQYIIPESVTAIGGYAFACCESLEYVHIPVSVTFIGGDAFVDATLTHMCSATEACYARTYAIENEIEFRVCTEHSTEEPTTEEPSTEEPTTEEPSTEEPTTEEPTTEEPTTEEPTTEEPTTSGTSENAVSGTCGDNLIWLLDTQTGLLEISGTGAMYDYDSFWNLSPWCEYISDIKSVIIGEGVTTIGVGAFIECWNLTNISIANTVTSIGVSAFENCQNLIEINIPTNLKSIGSEAFNWCRSIEAITIPKSVTNIGEFAFIGCSSLTSITVDEENSIYSSDSFGVLFDKNKTKLIQYPTGSNMISYTVPDSVTEIQDYAFANNSNLEELMISDRVTIIGEGVFEDCTGLTNVMLPDSLTSIGDCAFSGCFALADVIIPKGVRSIGESTFYNCRNLGDVIIPDSITRIGRWAFYNCDSFMNITIPDGVVSIEEGAFMYCTGLTDVTIGKDVASIGEQAFLDCTSLTNINVDGDNKHYSNDSFGVLFNKNKSELIQYPVGNTRNNYIIPDSVMTIGDYAFLDCRSLTSVTIPNSVTNIGDEVFYYCYNIEYIHIPTSVLTIGEEAFYYGANYICSTTENCFAKTYAKENNIEFRVCNGHEESEHEHTPKTVTVPASCTVNGMEYTVCAECGEPIGEVTVIPAGHTPGEWETVIEPTVDTNGKRVKKCTVCGEILEEEAIAKLKVSTAVDEKTGVEMEYVADDYEGEVEITVEEAFDGEAFDIIDTTLNSTQKFIYDITMTVNGVATQPNGKVTVKIPLPSGYDHTRTFVYHVDSNTGKIEPMYAEYKDGYLVFETTHFSYYALVEVLDVELIINKTSTNKINFGDTLVLTLGEIEIPEGYAIAWLVEGAGVSTWVSEDGLECRVTSIANGNPTIYAKLVDEEENVITNADGEEIFDEITLVSKAGFWQKFISFFKNLFGINRVIY